MADTTITKIDSETVEYKTLLYKQDVLDKKQTVLEQIAYEKKQIDEKYADRLAKIDERLEVFK